MVKIHGNDKNIYLAQFLIIKARKMQMTEGINPELTLVNVQRAVEIHEEIEKDKPLKSVHLGRYLYFKGTVLMGLKRYAETIRCFERSKEILGRVPEFEELVNQLTYEINNLK
jgi:hypothetical protein